MSTLFDPIPQLKLSDTFYNWWEVTNEISAALNPLNIYDVSAGYGITLSRSEGNVTISVLAGCGLKFDGNYLTLDIREATEDTNGPNSSDFYIFERSIGSTDQYPNTTDGSDCETLRKVRADQVLPSIVAGTHTFSGSITVDNAFTAGASSGNSTMRFRSNAIRLGSPTGSTSKSSISSIGFFIDTNDDDPNWVFRGDISGWYTNQNIGISYDQAFVCDAPAGLNVAKFNFAPVTGQHNTQLNLLLGDRTADGITTTDTDESISFTALQDTQSISVEYIETNGQKTTLFTGSNAGGNVFTVGGKIFITDIQNSSQFSTQSDYSIYKVPLTNTNGILDYRFTNRLVATNYSVTLVVGDVVRFDGTNYVAAQANNETNSRVVGIVERIDGGKATIALSGVFTSSSLTAGNVYYLDQSTAGAVTTTKPTSGLIKEVYVGLTTTTGMLFSSAISSGPTFANVQITGDDLVTADVSGDTLVLTAGNNINIERNTNNEILISAGTLSEANYFSTISPDVGTITAATANDTLVVTGERGILTYRNSSNQLVIRGGRSFSTVEILGQNTNELDYTVQAVTGEDTLYLRSGVGINIVSSTDNDILIEATGVSIPADESITNAKLADMPAFSIKGAQANGRPTDIYVINPADELSSGNYTVTQGVGLNPTTYTDNINPSLVYDSIQSISGNSVLARAPHEDIAGYVYGRWTDETGHVSNIIPLRRTELRSILGASPDGFLEENSNLFNSWYLYNDGVGTTATDSATASDKAGELVFIAGDNISLTKVATGNPDNKPNAIKIDASGNLGFNRIVNNRTGIDMLSGETSGVIEITDNGSISVNVDTNNGLTFDIKPESVTNEMLANMPFNSIKASVYNTDEPNPIDLVLDTNTIVGRGSGNLKALTPTEVRQILGLSSSQYFKTLKIENSGASVTATVNASDSPDQEFFSLRAGSNITLTKVSGTNTITISSLGSSSGGLNTVSVNDIGTTVTANDLTTLNFNLVNLNYPTGFGTTGNYKNIDYLPTGPTSNILGLSLDLALMPQYSVKVASNTSTKRHGADGYPAANLILSNNQVLCRVSDENSLVGKTVAELASGGGGIPYLSSIGSNTLTPGPKTLDITAGSNCQVILLENGNNLQYTINCLTTLSTDTSPTLGANLNVNKKTFIGPSSAASTPASGNRTIAEFVQNRISAATASNAYFRFDTTNTSSPAVISLIEERLSGESSVGNKDITITPLGTGGRVNITNGIISTAATNGPFTINSTRNVPYGQTTTPNHLLNQHINLLSGTANDVSIGTLGTGNVGKNLNFYASQIATGNLGSKDITFVYTKNTGTQPTDVLQIDRLITRGNDNSIGIFTTNTSGNLILAAGAAAGTAGAIPSEGFSSIQFNSHLLMSGKSIRAANNNITIDTFTNDYTGALVVKATDKSGFHRVKSGTRNNGTTTEIDKLPTSNATEKANKYMLYMQDTTTSSTCAIVEFTVLANNATYALKINSIIKNGIGETTFVELKTSTSLSGSPVDETGSNPTPNPGQACGIFTTTSGFLSVVIDPCLSGTFNYTLYKMSIQA
jgi:hypothetical protein